MSNIDTLANDIARELQRYANLVEEDIEDAKEKVATDLVNELKQKVLRKQESMVKAGGKRKMAVQSLFIMR